MQYHAFNAAVCLGTLILARPQNVLAVFALSRLDTAIGLYSQRVEDGDSTRALTNLHWLKRLRSRGWEKISRPLHYSSLGATNFDDAEDEEAELIGWRTRLIDRVGKGQNGVRSIDNHFVTNAELDPSASFETSAPALHNGVGAINVDADNEILGSADHNADDLTDHFVSTLTIYNQGLVGR